MLVAPLLSGLLCYVVGAVGLVVVLVAGAASIGWQLGRLHQVKVDERLSLIALLEPFTEWAEQALAAQPDELDAEQEHLRDCLQRDYHDAQRLLEKLRG